MPIAGGSRRRWAAQVARILEAPPARVRHRIGAGLAPNCNMLVHGLLLCQRQPGGGDRERQAAISPIVPFGRRQAFRRVRAVALRVIRGQLSVALRPILTLDLSPADDAGLSKIEHGSVFRDAELPRALHPPHMLPEPYRSALTGLKIGFLRKNIRKFGFWLISVRKIMIGLRMRNKASLRVVGACGS
jgi:hypothetical protein